MPWIDFNALSKPEAEQLLALVRAREPARLHELGRWVAATGGPVDALDGSWSSLVPLWEWLIGFVDDGLPLVSAAARPANHVHPVPVRPLPPLLLPLLYVAESVAHYCAVVARRAAPGADWVV